MNVVRNLHFLYMILVLNGIILMYDYENIVGIGLGHRYFNKWYNMVYLKNQNG